MFLVKVPEIESGASASRKQHSTWLSYTLTKNTVSSSSFFFNLSHQKKRRPFCGRLREHQPCEVFSSQDTPSAESAEAITAAEEGQNQTFHSLKKKQSKGNRQQKSARLGRFGVRSMWIFSSQNSLPAWSAEATATAEEGRLGS